MEQRSRIEKQPERRAKPTGKAEKVGLGPWYGKYTYQEQTDNQRELHGDPRSEQSHGQHQDSDLISSDGDPKSFHPASGIGATLDHYASDSSASDQGTLAGARWTVTYRRHSRYASEPRRRPELRANELSYELRERRNSDSQVDYRRSSYS